MQYTPRSYYANAGERILPRVGDMVRLADHRSFNPQMGVYHDATYTVLSIREWDDGDIFIRVTPEQHRTNNGVPVSSFYVLGREPLVTQTRRLTVLRNVNKGEES